MYIKTIFLHVIDQMNIVIFIGGLFSDKLIFNRPTCCVNLHFFRKIKVISICPFFYLFNNPFYFVKTNMTGNTVIVSCFTQKLLLKIFLIKLVD